MNERATPRLDDIKDTQVQPDLATPVRDDTPAPGSGTVGAMEPELQAFIGRQLRQTYDEVLNEPVPDRFLELLKELEELEAGKADEA
jgi:hypothetical protein